MILDVLLLVLAYLLGSCSFGLLIARLYGTIDLRHSGSGNIGATNVARTLGRTAGIATLLGDGLKGLLAVLLAQKLGQHAGLPAAAALAAVLGHMFPLYHGFRGGKGVATALGVLLPLLPLPLLGGLGAWLIVVVWSRYVSVGSIVAALVVPLLAVLRASPPALIAVSTLIALLVVYQHRGNILRLCQGTEARF